MNKQDLIEVVSKWTKDEFYQRCADGHTVWDPAAVVGWGFTKEWVSDITQKHKSGEHFKEQLYNLVRLSINLPRMLELTPTRPILILVAVKLLRHWLKLSITLCAELIEQRMRF